MTPDMLALQRRCENLMKENETMARDNAELRRQIEAIKQAAIDLGFSSESDMDTPPVVCLLCKYKDALWCNNLCVECCNVNNRKNWQPPDA